MKKKSTLEHYALFVCGLSPDCGAIGCVPHKSQFSPWGNSSSWSRINGPDKMDEAVPALHGSSHYNTCSHKAQVQRGDQNVCQIALTHTRVHNTHTRHTTHIYTTHTHTPQQMAICTQEKWTYFFFGFLGFEVFGFCTDFFEAVSKTDMIHHYKWLRPHSTATKLEVWCTGIQQSANLFLLPPPKQPGKLDSAG